MTLLKVDNLGIRFGGLSALEGACFSVKKAEIVSVIGPNGAGKTTLFNLITGIYEPSTGCLEINSKSPKEKLKLKNIAQIFLASSITAVALFLLLNIESIWEALITGNYIYQEAFPWNNIIPSFKNLWASLSWSSTYGTLIAGALLGAASYIAMWNRVSPEIVKKCGLARTFQNIRIFSKMSVLENILVGMHCSLSNFSNKKAETKAREAATEILNFVGLKDYGDYQADKLSYGHQRRLEIARALASRPELILLDEPAAGMNPSEAEDLMGLIKKIQEKGISVLLIEHHMKVVMGISEKIVVLNYGEKIAEGTPDQIKQNPEVIKAYLGS